MSKLPGRGVSPKESPPCQFIICQNECAGKSSGDWVADYALRASPYENGDTICT